MRVLEIRWSIKFRKSCVCQVEVECSLSARSNRFRCQCRCFSEYRHPGILVTQKYLFDRQAENISDAERER